MMIHYSPNFLSDLVDSLNAAKNETTFQEKQSGWWNDAKMMASYGLSNPWQMTKATGSGLGQGLTNVGRGAKGIAETTAGGIGTALTGVAAGVEGITDAAGMTDPSFNTSWQAAKNMGEFTAGGAKNVGDVFGAGGADALMGRGPDHVTQSHERMMDEAGYGDTAKMLTRGGLGVGRIAAEAVPYVLGPGAVGGAAKAVGGAAKATARGGKTLGVFPGAAQAGVQAAKNPKWNMGAALQVASDFTGNKPVNPVMQSETAEFKDNSSVVPSPAQPEVTPSPAAPPDNYKGFEIDEWRPRSGKDTFKMSADINFNYIKNLAILASRRHYGHEVSCENVN